MKKAVYLIILLFLTPLIFISQADSNTRGISVINDLSHSSGKLGAYRALIIGINDYKDPKIPDLETAVNDAKTIAELLHGRYGFKYELILDRNATREAIYQALRNLALTAKPDESILIYYAGHGDLDRAYNDGWWIPSDAVAGKPATYLDNVQVQKAMRSMQARHVLLISDSCYSGTLFGQARAMPPIIDDKYYLNLYTEISRWGMTSGNKTPVSDRGSSGHSVFAYQLIKALRKNEKPYISTQELYTRIAPIVGNNSEQTPLCLPVRNTGDQGGQFIFVATKGKITDGGGISAERQRLEQERKELERIKAEFEERQKIEAERKRIESEKKKFLEQIASVSPTVTNTRIVVRDGQYEALASGIVYDRNTGLEWYAGPNKDTTWNTAKTWVENLNVAGGGWRMPTREELKTLYKKDAGTRNMTSLLKTTGWWIWLESRDSSSGWYYDCYNASFGRQPARGYSSGLRAFAVRFHKQ